MYGAIIGDILGSKYEFHNIKTKNFKLFDEDMFYTDDTVMTCAVCTTLLDYFPITESIKKWYRRYPDESYGTHFRAWVEGGCKGISHSMGNGSAMRISPVGMCAENEEDVRRISRKLTMCSHSHPDGMKGAEATAMMVYLARNGWTKDDLERRFHEDYYAQKPDLDALRNDTTYWGEMCYNTVPQAMECFFRSVSFEDCMRNCISIGGDSDTIGAIAGGVAEAYYGVPAPFLVRLGHYLSHEILDVLELFYRRYGDDNWRVTE